MATNIYFAGDQNRVPLEIRDGQSLVENENGFLQLERPDGRKVLVNKRTISYIGID